MSAPEVPAPRPELKCESRKIKVFPLHTEPWERRTTAAQFSLETSVLKSFKLVIQPTIRPSPGAGSRSERALHSPRKKKAEKKSDVNTNRRWMCVCWTRLEVFSSPGERRWVCYPRVEPHRLDCVCYDLGQVGPSGAPLLFSISVFIYRRRDGCRKRSLTKVHQHQPRVQQLHSSTAPRLHGK